VSGISDRFSQGKRKIEIIVNPVKIESIFKSAHLFQLFLLIAHFKTVLKPAERIEFIITF